MAFCKFYRTVAVKTFFLEINILIAKLWDVRVAITKIMAELTFKIFLSGRCENDFLPIMAENDA